MLGPCFLTLRTLLPVEHETIQNHVQGKSAFKGLLLPTIGGHSSLFQRTDSCLGPELHRHHEMDLQLWKHWQRNCAQVVGLWIRVTVWIQDSLHLKKLQSPVITSDTPIMVYIYMRVLHYITLPYVIHASMHPASQPYIPIYLYLHTYRTNTFILKYVSPYDKKLYTNCIYCLRFISQTNTLYTSQMCGVHAVHSFSAQHACSALFNLRLSAKDSGAAWRCKSWKRFALSIMKSI